ncbi:MAG: ferritin-like domain-containing protein [Clostridia bacterium]|nr:ferritin-like domain-containing protein [Clostridia bacterium]
MNTAVPKKLQSYINSELHDAEVYRILAKSAPNEDIRNILMRFADNEQAHADEFTRIYKMMTGYSFEPEPVPITESGSYRAILKNRILDETKDAEKYRKDYLQTHDNFNLKRALFNAFNDEMRHAVEILYILI